MLFRLGLAYCKRSCELDLKQLHMRLYLMEVPALYSTSLHWYTPHFALPCFTQDVLGAMGHLSGTPSASL